MDDKTGHTPGPWQVQEPHQPWDDDERAVFVISGGKPGTQHEGLIAACCRTSVRDDHAEDVANSYLIAAAPDLYNELRHLVSLLEPLERDGCLDVPGLATLNGARKVLAKVEGNNET